MPLPATFRSIDFGALFQPYTAQLSIPLCFGLGAGLHFEYLQRPTESPSRFILGFNRNLQVHLSERIAAFQNGEYQVVSDAMRENARLFNIDRAPTIALLGMEMLAEQLPDLKDLRDGRVCLQGMAATIFETDALYRRLYGEFLDQVSMLELRAATFKKELDEIASEWNMFAAQLQQASVHLTELERASRMLRRLAFREEHFWGSILDL